MIQQWRMNWGQGDFPFLYVQLANYSFEPQVFPGLREAQLMTLSLPETAMAVTIDIGDSTDIHPKNKQEVGRRLALAARKVAYDEDIIYSGPLFKYMYVSDGKCKLSFNQIGDGLAIKGGESLSGFVIAGVDRHFVQANAVLDNDQVVV
jgi:sialate O-acetylesterase